MKRRKNNNSEECFCMSVFCISILYLSMYCARGTPNDANVMKIVLVYLHVMCTHRPNHKFHEELEKSWTLMLNWKKRKKKYEDNKNNKNTEKIEGKKIYVTYKLDYSFVNATHLKCIRIFLNSHLLNWKWNAKPTDEQNKIHKHKKKIFKEKYRITAPQEKDWCRRNDEYTKKLTGGDQLRSSCIESEWNVSIIFSSSFSFFSSSFFFVWTSVYLNRICHHHHQPTIS